jgi:hypothetical protein
MLRLRFALGQLVKITRETTVPGGGESLVEADVEATEDRTAAASFKTCQLSKTHQAQFPEEYTA